MILEKKKATQRNFPFCSFETIYMLVPFPIEYTATLVNAPAATAEATVSAATAERIIPNISYPPLS